MIQVLCPEGRKKLGSKLFKSTTNLKRKKKKNISLKSIIRSKSLSNINHYIDQSVIYEKPPKIATREEFVELTKLNSLESSAYFLPERKGVELLKNHIKHFDTGIPNIQYQIYPLHIPSSGLRKTNPPPGTQRPLRRQARPNPERSFSNNCFRNNSKHNPCVDHDLFDGFVNYKLIPIRNRSIQSMNHEDFNKIKRHSETSKRYYDRNVMVAPVGNMPTNFQLKKKCCQAQLQSDSSFMSSDSNSTQDDYVVMDVIQSRPGTRHHGRHSSMEKRPNVYLPKISRKYNCNEACCKKPSDCCRTNVQTDCGNEPKVFVPACANLNNPAPEPVVPECCKIQTSNDKDFQNERFISEVQYQDPRSFRKCDPYGPSQKEELTRKCSKIERRSSPSQKDELLKRSLKNVGCYCPTSSGKIEGPRPSQKEEIPRKSSKIDGCYCPNKTEQKELSRNSSEIERRYSPIKITKTEELSPSPKEELSKRPSKIEGYCYCPKQTGQTEESGPSQREEFSRRPLEINRRRSPPKIEKADEYSPLQRKELPRKIAEFERRPSYTKDKRRSSEIEMSPPSVREPKFDSEIDLAKSDQKSIYIKEVPEYKSPSVLSAEEPMQANENMKSYRKYSNQITATPTKRFTIHKEEPVSISPVTPPIYGTMRDPRIDREVTPYLYKTISPVYTAVGSPPNGSRTGFRSEPLSRTGSKTRSRDYGSKMIKKCNINICKEFSAAMSITYATTVITRYPTFTVYEILRSSRKKPPNICKVTEQVFVVKNARCFLPK